MLDMLLKFQIPLKTNYSTMIKAPQIDLWHVKHNWNVLKKSKVYSLVVKTGRSLF